jgi:hypothetical protein
MSSELFKVFHNIPKGGVHNLHLAGGVPPELLLQLTYDPDVYFSQREKFFKISRVYFKL